MATLVTVREAVYRQRLLQLLTSMPDLQTFLVGQAVRTAQATGTTAGLYAEQRRQARWEARHIVRSGLRDVVDWLEANGHDLGNGRPGVHQAARSVLPPPARPLVWEGDGS